MKKSIALLAVMAPILALLLLCGVFLAGTRDTRKQSWFLAAKTSELPSDGSPILKTVSVKAFDAWMRLPDRPLLDVFVRRSGNTDGASVLPSWHHDSFRIPLRYDQIKKQYISACWNVAFDMQGKEISESESIRTDSSLTQLPVQVVDGDVWVRLDDVMY